MQSSIRKTTGAGSSKAENALSGNADEEEDWGRVKDEDGGGGGAAGLLKELSQKEHLHSIEPIIQALSRLRKRNFQWHRILHPRQGPELDVDQNVSDGVIDGDNEINPSLAISIDLPVDVPTDIPSIGSISQTFLSETPPPSPVLTTPTITNIPPTITDSINPPAAPLPTITSFVSNFAPNGTTSRTTKEGTVIVITTSGIQNLTRTMTPKTSGRSSSGKSSSRSGSTTITILTTLLPSPTNTYEVINDGGPFPTIDQHTPPAPTSSGDVSGGGGDDPPVQPKLLGGIFGGIAGLGIMLYLILLLLKRHKRRQRIQAQEDAGYGGPLEAGGSQSMVQRSMSFLGAAGLVSRYHRTDPEPEPQERGFVRVSGRKLPPVIGGPRPDYGSMRSAGEASSYYRDDDVSLGGVNAPATPVSSIGPGRYSSPPPPGSPSFQPTGTPSRLREGLDSDSGGLATSGSYRSSKTQVRQPLYLRQLAASDGVGRSLASRDGSKASRFTEDVT